MSGTARSWCLGLFAMAWVFAAGWFAGADHANGAQHDKLAAIGVREAVWESTAKAAQGALTDIGARLKQQQQDLAAVRRIADAALDGRDAANATNADLREQLKNALKAAVHEDPECADLALPLCPAVAERLFTPARRRAPPGD